MVTTTYPLSLLILAVLLVGLGASSCTTTTTTTSAMTSPIGPQQDKPQGFFERVADSLTERECNVVRFTCPYGWGSAGEPCDCTDPKGVVLKGLTVK